MKLSDQLVALNDPYVFFFKSPKSRLALRRLVEYMKDQGGVASKSDISHFADNLAKNKILSRQKFYGTVLKTMKETGFIIDNVPAYGKAPSSKTAFPYRLARFAIPRKVPTESDGFWRLAWYVCRHWNMEIWGNISFDEDDDISHLLNVTH